MNNVIQNVMLIDCQATIKFVFTDKRAVLLREGYECRSV